MSEPLTLADLRTLPPSDEIRLGVIGDPVAHSKSPLFQNAALRACGIKGHYDRIHLRPSELAEGLTLLRAAGYCGLNVTVPHKFAVQSALDEIDPHARRLGAVNTISFGPKSVGFNTDGPGFVRAIREVFGQEIASLRILVLGAGGGAGHALAVQCRLENVAKLYLANRTPEKIALLASDLSATAIPLDPAAIAPLRDEIDLIVNCTTVGMSDAFAPLPASALSPRHLVFDTIYTGQQTPLQREATTAGARHSNGLPMLLHQGALSFEEWFSRPAPLEAMRVALNTP